MSKTTNNNDLMAANKFSSNPNSQKPKNPSDEGTVAGFEILDDIHPFHQKNDVFRRSWWDERIRTEKSALFYATYRDPLKTWRTADGFTQKDYALCNATWLSVIFLQNSKKAMTGEKVLQMLLPCSGMYPKIN